MSPLTPEDKQRIRREEEARHRAAEEERYRAEVRAELGAAPEAEAAPDWDEPPTVEKRLPLAKPAPAPRRAPAPAKAPPRPAKRVAPAPAEVYPDDAAADEAYADQAYDESPQAVPARQGANWWWWVAALLMVAGVTLVVIWVARGSAGDSTKPSTLELSLKAGGPIAEIARREWRPSDLATDEYAITPDGKVTRVPGRGMATFEELRAAYEAPAPVMDNPFPPSLSLAELEAKYRATPPDPAMPRMRPPSTRNVPREAYVPAGKVPDVPIPPPEIPPDLPIIPPDAHVPSATDEALTGLLAFAPSRAWLVVGLDRAHLLRSPTLALIHGQLALGLGQAPPLSVLGGAPLMSDASALVYAGGADGADADTEYVVAALSSAVDAVRERAVAYGATASENPVRWLALPGGEGLILEPGRFAIARKGSTPALLAARVGDSVLTGGELAAMVRRVRPGAAIFAALRVQKAQAADLESLARGLSSAQAIGMAVTINAIGDDIAVTMQLAFADMMTATSVLGDLEQKRLAAATLPQGPLLQRIQARIDGAIVILTLHLQDAELKSLLPGMGD